MALKEMVKLVSLDGCLRKGSTGDSHTLAKTVGISRSSLFNLFDELKSLGADIEYDSKFRTYCYRNKFEIKLTVEKGVDTVLILRDLEKIVDGTTGFAPI